nr:integrase, catalytic region, zinc finger, CCHC-type, peptidase aspartic, catalytic [Tanacetum cinerariifolium]
MSRDVITVGSTMRIPLLYRVSLARTAHNAPPTLKDPKFWIAEEQKTRKIDRLARSLLIQGLPNDIYLSLIAMKLLKTYGMLLKGRCVVLSMKAVVVHSDPLALVAEKTNVSKRKEKYVVSSDSKGSGSDDFSELKKITALLAKEGHFAKYCKKVKVKDYEYYKTKMLLAKKDKDKHVLLAEDQAWMESSSDSDQEINENMVFMAQIEKVLFDSEASSSSADEKISEIIIDLENDVINLLKKEKANLETIESLKSKGCESSETVVSESENQNENDCHEIEKEYDKEENPKIIQICLWIIDSGCSKHMTGNRALLMNFVEKFLGMVRFGNNDFAVIAGCRDVVIGSMTIKKFYYVEGLGHNLFSIGQFCDKGLEVAFRKSTCFVRNEDGVDLLTGDRSSNLYTIALNEVASNSSTYLLAKASSL